MLLNKFFNKTFKYFLSASFVLSVMLLLASSVNAQTARIFFNPSSATLPPITNIQLMMDVGIRQIGFAKIEFRFDPSVIKLTDEIATIPKMSTIIEKTNRDVANTEGYVKIIVALPPENILNAPAGQFEFAHFPISAYTTLPNLSTSLAILDQNVQIVDMNVTEVPFASETSEIFVNPDTNPSIFAERFESGSLSKWTSCTTDSGDLSVTPEAKYTGGYVMKVLLDDTNSIYCTSEHPNGEKEYKASFFFDFDPAIYTMTNGNLHTIFGGYSGTSTLTLDQRVQLQRASNNYQIRASLLNDGTTWTNTGWFTINDPATNDPHRQIKFDWRSSTAAGANNGGMTLWINGFQVANLTGVDNDQRKIDSVKIGAVAGVKTGTNGPYYIDEFESSRENTVLTHTPTPTPIVTSTPTPIITATPTPTPTPSTGTLTFLPTDDTFVKSDAPTNYFGSNTALKVKSGSVTMNIYLKFNVTGLSGQVQSAKVRLNVSDASSVGGSIFSTSNTYLSSSTPWIESGLNWSNAPAAIGSSHSTVGSAGLNTWVEFAVTPAITGDGIYSFMITSTSSDAVFYKSGEASSNRPELVITLGSGPTPTPTSIITSTPTPTPITTSSPTQTPTPPSLLLTFTPTDDAFVKSDLPDSNFGGNTVLKAKSSAPEILTFLKFNLIGFSGRVQSAKVRLNVSDASPVGGDIYSALNDYFDNSGPWTESGITWNNAPNFAIFPTSSVGNAALNAWVEFDVTSLINGSGIYSFAIESSSTDAVFYKSSEASSSKPELVITL